LLEGLITETHTAENKQLSPYLNLSGPLPRLRAIAEVLTDSRLPEDEIEIDETLRTALGIEMDDALATQHFTIKVLPLYVPLRYMLSEYFLKLLIGYRHTYARVSVAFVAYLDKPVGRVPIFAFPLLGIEDGGGVICESAFLTDDVQVFGGRQ
jgi:hypothetical protein